MLGHSVDLESEDASSSGKRPAAGSPDDDAQAARKRGKIVRVMLTAEQAKAIYERRPNLDEILGRAPGALAGAQVVAKDYDVSAKTIRDIWNRYSWAKVTKHLWTDAELRHFVQSCPSRGHQAVVHIPSQDSASECATPRQPNTPPSPTLTATSCSSMPSRATSRATSTAVQPPSMQLHQQQQQFQQQVNQQVNRPDQHLHAQELSAAQAQAGDAGTHLKIFGSGMTFEILKRNQPQQQQQRFPALPHALNMNLSSPCDTQCEQQRGGYGNGRADRRGGSSADFGEQMKRILGSSSQIQSMMQQVLGNMRNNTPKRASVPTQAAVSQLDLDVEALQGQIDEAQMRLNQLIKLKQESKLRLQQQSQQQQQHPQHNAHVRLQQGFLEQQQTFNNDFSAAQGFLEQQQTLSDFTQQLHNFTNGLCFPV